jgi:hypothetical protein
MRVRWSVFVILCTVGSLTVPTPALALMEWDFSTASCSSSSFGNTCFKATASAWATKRHRQRHPRNCLSQQLPRPRCDQPRWQYQYVGIVRHRQGLREGTISNSISPEHATTTISAMTLFWLLSRTARTTQSGLNCRPSTLATRLAVAVTGFLPAIRTSRCSHMPAVCLRVWRESLTGH